MLDRKRLELHSPDAKRAPSRDNLTPLDRIAVKGRPGGIGRVHRAGCAVAKAAGVVGMRVSDDDRRRPEPFEPATPVQTPVDDELAPAIGDEEGAVAAVPSRARLDLAACAEEAQLQTRSRSSETPSASAQCAQQKIRPSDSTPWPMIRQPQCAHVGASAWIAHSKLSNVCVVSPRRTSNALSYSFPQTSQTAMSLPRGIPGMQPNGTFGCFL
jgi:hypothetical protein